jgi:hypothetical protein
MASSSSFSEVYEPRLLAALQEIYDVAWQEIQAFPNVLVAAENKDKRQAELAQMIILAHRSGMPPEETKTALLTEISSFRQP